MSKMEMVDYPPEDPKAGDYYWAYRDTWNAPKVLLYSDGAWWSCVMEWCEADIQTWSKDPIPTPRLAPPKGLVISSLRGMSYINIEIEPEYYRKLATVYIGDVAKPQQSEVMLSSEKLRALAKQCKEFATYLETADE